MDGSFLDADALFECKDCATKLVIPDGAWAVAASKLQSPRGRRGPADKVAISA